MLGMKSINVCVIDIETMNMAIIIGSVNLRKNADDETRIAPTRFMWSPGIRPVKVPTRMPMSKARKISNNIIFN